MSWYKLLIVYDPSELDANIKVFLGFENLRRRVAPLKDLNLFEPLEQPSGGFVLYSKPPQNPQLLSLLESYGAVQCDPPNWLEIQPWSPES